jgi:AraC-like DNA-binding protein
VNENGSGFSEYINAARVREAQRILTDLDFKNYTIVAIGLECGFNSKSTFYNSFKKVTQESPTDFRKRMLE